MNLSVSNASIACMIICLFLAVILPSFLFVYLKKKLDADAKPFYVGCITFFIFAFVLESVVNFGISHSPIWPVINGSNLLFALFGGLMAGIFEETGRLCAYKTVLKHASEDDSTAIMYGAGHGGIEVLLVLGITMINNLIYSVMINAGNTASITGSLPPEQLAAVESLFVQIAETKPLVFLTGIIERIAAIAIHMSLSVVVWAACKNKSKFWLFPVAIVMHAFADFIMALLMRFGISVIVIEIINYVVAAGLVAFAVFVWKKIIKAEGENK